MRRIAMLLLMIAALGFVAEGCHAQVPPTNYQVALSWTAPATSCTTATPCTYVLSRAVLAAGTVSCPQTSGTAFTPLNLATPVSTLTYNDAAASGETVCYIVQTEWTAASAGCSTAAPCFSLPSNTAGPFVLPGTPQAPTLTGTQQVAALDPEKTIPCPDCSITVPASTTTRVGHPLLTAKLEPGR